ncbi:tRNA lysidine(34) synthetase TilS [Tindallia californiensis]|uniref:tRNA(Ile)-lysidine synthase n=1 Tax=Tindallia californiensis TaxID=159292 RepID=A0A1H3L1I8_9FIRM|nr:tRNA lysidine(34) synthetase TilS [Tindallia californiensis]SDY58261.1 tRNA(Ile)-lysidine synthase [Tindallia californiensis]
MKDSVIIKKVIESKQLNVNDHIVVGFSGGADSVCLLHALFQLADTYRLQIVAAHLNHNLRGMDSNEDATFAMNFARRHQITCVVKSVDIAKSAKEEGISLETAGRISRYQFFEEVAEKIGANKIALAHHQNDQAETILMNLIRGAGLEGLSGMPMVRDKIMRPLLHCRREQIEEYCRYWDLPYQIDQSNQETEYFRNKIRLELIPKIKKYQPNVIESIGKTSVLLEQDRQYIEEKVEEAYSEVLCYKTDKVISISPSKLLQYHPSIVSRVIRKAYMFFNTREQTISFDQVHHILSLLDQKKTEKEVQLPGEIKVLFKTDEIKIGKKEDIEKSYSEETMKEAIPLKIPGITRLVQRNGYFRCEVVNIEKMKNRGKDPYCQYFDFDQLPEHIVVRNRREGDRLKPLGTNGSKKVKDFFIDQKIPVEKRNMIPLIASENEILWVVGHRISELVKITQKTKKVLKIQFRSDKVQ